MRTTFFQMCLFNDDQPEHETSFIMNRKEWGASRTEGDIERMKSERQSVGEKGLRHGS